MEDDIKRALDKIHRNSYYGTYIDDKHKRLEEARETATQAPKIGSILDMSDDDFDAVAASRHQFAVGDFISTIHGGVYRLSYLPADEIGNWTEIMILT